MQFEVFDANRKQFIPVAKATPIPIPGWESFRFFVHRPYTGEAPDLFSKSGWVVSEANSGGFITREHATRAGAIQTAKKLLSECDVPRVQAWMQSAANANRPFQKGEPVTCHGYPGRVIGIEGSSLVVRLDSGTIQVDKGDVTRR